MKERFCKICGKKITHNLDIDLCEDCLKKGFEELENVLKKLSEKKKNENRN